MRLRLFAIETSTAEVLDLTLVTADEQLLGLGNFCRMENF
jgi:hypothetical protein